MFLNNQISEYDCGPTSLLNAVSYLYKRDEIPVELIRIIYRNSLDCKKYIIGDCGTSKKAMRKIVRKINSYSYFNSFDLKLTVLEKNNADICKIINCLKNNGVVVVRSYLDLEHYYLITRYENNIFYICDPYLDIDKNPYNYQLSIDDLDNEENNNYSLGEIKNRQIILFNKL